MTKLRNLLVTLNVESRKRKKALMLHQASDDVFQIYETLNLGEDDSNYDIVKQELTKYFSSRKNKELEWYEFRYLQQRKDGTTDQFATRLRQKAENCEFVNIDGEIQSQIIQGCVSRKLHLKCLEEEKQLMDLLTMTRTMEIAEEQFI